MNAGDGLGGGGVDRQHGHFHGGGQFRRQRGRLAGDDLHLLMSRDKSRRRGDGDVKFIRLQQQIIFPLIVGFGREVDGVIHQLVTPMLGRLMGGQVDLRVGGGRAVGKGQLAGKMSFVVEMNGESLPDRCVGDPARRIAGLLNLHV